MAELALGCVLSWTGGSLELENEAGGYSLERDAMADLATSWRRHEVQNRWVAGSYVIGAVKENVELPLHVYVTADTGSQLQDRLNALTTMLDRLAYELAFTEDGVTMIWNCQVADYTVTRSQSLRVARHALVKAVVPAHPVAARRAA